MAPNGFPMRLAWVGVAASCLQCTVNRFPVVVGAAVGAAKAGPRSSGHSAGGGAIGNGNVLTRHGLDDPNAVCLAGHPASVYTFLNPAGVDRKQWVIQLGSSSSGIDMCLDPARCELVAKYLNVSGAAAGLPMLAGNTPNTSLMMGIQSQNCTENPTFCNFNQAQLMMCDYAMLMSDAERIGPVNNTPLHFRGLKILAASFEKLGQLGLKHAESVLLTGIGHGGTAVFLHADRIRSILREIAPNI